MSNDKITWGMPGSAITGVIIKNGQFELVDTAEKRAEVEWEIKPAIKAQQSEKDQLRETELSVDAPFVVLTGSDSAHCCFEFTVVEKTGEGCKTVCECFDLEDAARICAALNATHSK